MWFGNESMFYFQYFENIAGKAKGRLWAGPEHSCIRAQAFPFSSIFLCSKKIIFILSLVFSSACL